MGVGQGARVDPGGHQAGEVRHVDMKERADLVRDLAEAREVDHARIGRAAGDDELGLVFPGEGLDLVEVDLAVLAAHAVLDRVEPLAREVRRRAVGQVTARGERHAENGVAGLQQGEQDALIGLRARMGLDIGEGAVEELAGALDRQSFGDIDVLAAAVVAPARIALGILVGQHRTLGVEDRARDDILRGDQLDLVALALQLRLDALGELGIGFGERCGEEGRQVRGIVEVAFRDLALSGHVCLLSKRSAFA